MRVFIVPWCLGLLAALIVFGRPAAAERRRRDRSNGICRQRCRRPAWRCAAEADRDQRRHCLQRRYHHQCGGEDGYRVPRWLNLRGRARLRRADQFVCVQSRGRRQPEGAAGRERGVPLRLGVRHGRPERPNFDPRRDPCHSRLGDLRDRRSRDANFCLCRGGECQLHQRRRQHRFAAGQRHRGADAHDVPDATGCDAAGHRRPSPRGDRAALAAAGEPARATARRRGLVATCRGRQSAAGLRAGPTRGRVGAGATPTRSHRSLADCARARAFDGRKPAQPVRRLANHPNPRTAGLCCRDKTGGAQRRRAARPFYAGSTRFAQFCQRSWNSDGDPRHR